MKYHKNTNQGIFQKTPNHTHLENDQALDVWQSHLKSYGLHDGNEKKEIKKKNKNKAKSQLAKH